MNESEMFKLRAAVQDTYRSAWEDGVRSFTTADSMISNAAHDGTTRKLRYELWRELKAGKKAARKSSETDADKPLAGGRVQSPDEDRERLSGRVFVVTAAQNNTHLHEDFWNGLLRYVHKRDATLLVSRFTYNKNAWRRVSGLQEGVNADAGDANQERNKTDLWFDPRIEPYTCDKQVKLADDLVFCGELDILPTAVTPLTGLQNYTGKNSGIVPHAKVHMQSLATMKHEPAKLMYTTGCVTLRNYIDRRAGQVATFHHTFAALVVEVMDDGQWFVRQLIADDNGVFYDLDTAYGPTWDAPSSQFGDTGITFGDFHTEKLDQNALGGAINMALKIGVKWATVHDLIDFTNRNHHNIKDPHFLVEQFYGPNKSVEQGMAKAAKLLVGIRQSMPDCKLFVIRSNHDQAFERWLKNTAAFHDPINADYWCAANAALLRSFRDGGKLDMFRWAIMGAAESPGDYAELLGVSFLPEDQSLVINDIEHGLHGHRGPNGARGNPKAYRQMGNKVNSAHTHSAGIIDGVWTAGTLSLLDLGYNAGPSSWSHSSILTYPSGKRTIITQRGARWHG